jgi:hypothetical protein
MLFAIGGVSLFASRVRMSSCVPAEKVESGRTDVGPAGNFVAEFVKVRRNLHQIYTKALFKLTPSA